MGSRTIDGLMKRKLIEADLPALCDYLATAQVTTDAYAIVPSSLIRGGAHNFVAFRVVNSDAANGITAKIMGRFASLDDKGNGSGASGWVNIGPAVEIALSSEDTLEVPGNEMLYDEYAVFVKATVGAAQGDVIVYGGAKTVPWREDVKVANVQPQSAAQETTNSYVIVAESLLTAPWANAVSFLVNNTDVANGITVKLVGRHISTGAGLVDDYGDWTLIGTEVAIAASSSDTLSMPFGSVTYDQYAIFVKATVGGSQGDAEVFGAARQLPYAPADLYPLSARYLTITVNAEAADDITVDLVSSHASADEYEARLYDATMLETLAAAFTLAESGAGAEVSTTAQGALLFTLSAAGAAQITVHDVAGASGLTKYLLIKPIGHLGPIQRATITFD